MLFFLILNLLIFIGLIFLIIYLPGFLFLDKVIKELNNSEKISLSLSLGIVLLVILAIVAGITNLRFLTLPILLSLGLISVIRFKKNIFTPFSLFFKDKLLTTMILFGILTQGFISFPSGYRYEDGLLFWSSQGFDGFWHISIIEEIKKEFPPQMPIFAGEKLINYHYLSDILMGEFARVTYFFSSLDLYFRFFPVFLSFLMGVSVFSFVNRWRNRKIAYWVLFFTYFTGSFGYILTFLRNGEFFGGETAFWVSQLNTVVANPPHAVAISLLLSFLLAFLIYLEKRNRYFFFLSIFCALIIVGFKVSAGVVLLAGLSAATVVDFVVNKKLNVVFLTVILGITNFITIKLMTRGVEGYLIFQPWWFIRTMVVEKLGLIEWEHRRQHYIAKGTPTAILRMLHLEATAFLIFLAGNVGMRILGFFEVFKAMFVKKYRIISNPFEVGLLTMMVVSFVFPMLFLQKGIVYNIIQFMQYFLLFLGFYAAISVTAITEFLKNKFVKFIFYFAVIIFSVPTVIGNLVEFYGPGRTPLAIITNEELNALQFLKNQPNEDSIVLSPAFNKYLKDKYKFQPRPIYVWYSTGYVSGLTGKRSYLASEDMVIQTGFDNEKRRSLVDKFFSQKNTAENRKFIKDEGIKYLYVPKAQIEKEIDPLENNLEKIFENSQVIIYKAN